MGPASSSSSETTGGVGSALRRRIPPFDEGGQRNDEELSRHLDLPEALATTGWSIGAE